MNTFEEVLYGALFEVMEQAWDQAEASLDAREAATEQDSGHA